jgi:Flp pilus assembly pilin Flp
MSNLRNNRGQGLVEYILLVVVMALLAIGGIRVLGKNTHNAFVQASDTLNEDMNTARTQGASDQAID